MNFTYLRFFVLRNSIALYVPNTMKKSITVSFKCVVVNLIRMGDNIINIPAIFEISELKKERAILYTKTTVILESKA